MSRLEDVPVVCYLRVMNLPGTFASLTASPLERYLENDPVSIPRKFHRRDDREIGAFIASALAYGRATIIKKSLKGLFARMPDGPAAFVRNFELSRDLHRLEGFVHRFHKGKDVAWLCLILKGMIERGGSIEGFFMEGFRREDPDIERALNVFGARALSPELLSAGMAEPVPSTVSYFFPRPEKGSACKRLCMFLRWMCRQDDGVDLGLWSQIPPSKLVIPLDTHVARISRLIGLTERVSPDWKTALAVTESLKRYDPEDPLRFDFLLAHLGISEGCTGSYGKACSSCPLSHHCRSGKKRD